MKIIGIDPGNEESALIIWDGRITSKIKTDNKKILAGLKYDPGLTSDYILVIEMIASYGMAVGKTVFETCLWIGRFMQAWESRAGFGYLSELIYRKDIKMHLCNSTRAKDANIRQALIDRFGKPGKKGSPNLIYDDAIIKMAKDLWAALAVCVTFEDLNKP